MMGEFVRLGVGAAVLIVLICVLFLSGCESGYEQSLRLETQRAVVMCDSRGGIKSFHSDDTRVDVECFR